MKAAEISNGLYWLLARQSYQIQIPNYTPIRWWESDHYAVTKAGFAVEFEIKTSMADFKADALKQKDTRVARDGWDIVRDEFGKMVFNEGQKKHDQLAARCTHGPSRFYFVCPEEVLQVSDMPEWAGLIWARKGTRTTYPACYEQKPAPKLHREKVPSGTLDNIHNAMYYRYWTLRTKMKTLPEIADHCPPTEGEITDDERS